MKKIGYTLNKIFAIVFLLYIVLYVSCNKAKKQDHITTSLKLIPFNMNFRYYKMVASNNGNLLVCGSINIAKPVLQLLKPNGEIMKTFTINDSNYNNYQTYIFPGADNGFLVINLGYKMCIAYKLDDNGNKVWTKIKTPNSGNSYLALCECTGANHNSYLLCCLVYDENIFNYYYYYLEKIDENGNTLYRKLLYPPLCRRAATGKFSDESATGIYEPDANTIVLEGSLQTDYSSSFSNVSQNTFLNIMSQNIITINYAQTFDSTFNETPVKSFFVSGNKIFQFSNQSKSSNGVDFYQSPSLKIFDDQGNLEKKIMYPLIDGTTYKIMDMIATNDGYCAVVKTDLQKKTNIGMMKINADGSMQWSKVYNNVNPATAYNIVALTDGTYGLLASSLMDTYRTSVFYLHLDANGNYIQ